MGKKLTQLTQNEIINKLKESAYKDRVYMYDTCLKQGEKRWGYKKRLQYEDKLRDDGLRHFAFIKFYLNEKGEKIGLVAGKSGSKNVIRKSDLSFSTNPKHGRARVFLIEEEKKWCQTEVLIIGAKAQDNNVNRKEAFEIERYLTKEFGLWGS
jgi:hypothetical protein